MKEKRLTKKALDGSFTIEMSIIMPVVLFIFMGIILSVFYYHDKNILNGAAYETVVVGSSKMREKEKITEAELESFCRDRIKRKCIFLTSAQINVRIQEEEILLELTAVKRGFGVSVVKRAALTEPENRIRDIRRLDSKNGEKNYD